MFDPRANNRPQHMTIEACPEGGFMVYTRAQEQDAFVKNTGHIVPLAAFADLDLALTFIREQMAAGPGKPAASTATVSTAELKPIQITSTIEWKKLSEGWFPGVAARMLLAVDDDSGPRVEPGHWDATVSAYVSPRTRNTVSGVVAIARMPAFPMMLRD